MLPTFDALLKISETKGKEYANGTNRFQNFVSDAEKYGVGADVVLMIFMNKHLNSLNHHVRTAESFSEPIEGRINDVIMYALLLKGLWRDMGKSGRPDDVNRKVSEIIQEQTGPKDLWPKDVDYNADNYHRLKRGDIWQEIAHPQNHVVIVQFPMNTHNVLYTYGAQELEMNGNEFRSKFTFIPSTSK